jgi:lipoyl(octanoyl) transferase
VPCGIEEFGVTSLKDLGREVSSAQWDEALLARLPAFLAKLDVACPPVVETKE